MITKALVVQKPGSDFEYREIIVEEDLRDNEALVEMKATGVCHTDLNFRNENSLPGLHPAVFGHEGERASCSLILWSDGFAPSGTKQSLKQRLSHVRDAADLN